MGFYGLSSQAQPWSFMDQWRRRIDLGWWVGLDSWVVDLWLCCVAVKPDWWWWWLRRMGLGWWVGLDLWIMDLWVCCVAMKPQTGSGGGCEGLVGVLAMLL